MDGSLGAEVGRGSTMTGLAVGDTGVKVGWLNAVGGGDGGSGKIKTGLVVGVPGEGVGSIGGGVGGKGNMKTGTFDVGRKVITDDGVGSPTRMPLSHAQD
mmetsp:Transcript_21634/g.32763  ORF Transcript_21634/g.32763 Transcript_21634/m.32763 type:complete len:100 (+) Transcript_21634:834-1133(+)